MEIKGHDQRQDAQMLELKQLVGIQLKDQAEKHIRYGPYPCNAGVIFISGTEEYFKVICTRDDTQFPDAACERTGRHRTQWPYSDDLRGASS